jgi:hypothetical protein
MLKTPVPMFHRKDVAVILNCTPLTISNREKAGTYPDPVRTSSNYRLYSLEDVFELQFRTYKNAYIGPVVAYLWDNGYKNVAELEKFVNEAYESWHNQKATTAGASI